MKITGIKIVVGRGPDYVMLMTDLPCATWPFEGFQSLETIAAAGTGVAYARLHFGIEPEVINMENNRKAFSK